MGKFKKGDRVIITGKVPNSRYRQRKGTVAEPQEDDGKVTRVFIDKLGIGPNRDGTWAWEDDQFVLDSKLARALK